MEVSLRYQLTPISLFFSGHLTDSECNQKLPSKKGSLIERKRSSGRVRRKGDELQASGYHSEGKPPCIVSLSLFTLSHSHSNCGFSCLLKSLSFFFDSGVWVPVMTLNIYSCFILCVFRRNTEREAGS